MELMLSNGALFACVDTLGGGLSSLRDARGRECLHPDGSFVPGRVKAERFFCGGASFAPPVRGFLPKLEMTLLARDENGLTLYMMDGDATRAVFPGAFTLTISYRLNGRKLEIEYFVQNDGEETLPFSIGGSPVFGIPTEERQPLNRSVELPPDTTWKGAWSIETEA